MIRIEKIEMVSYLILVLGLTLDHLTTNFGINNHNLYELNVITRTLMEIGIWVYVDILVCILFIFTTYQSYRIILEKKYSFMFFFPFISGFVRILIGVRNLTLI
jgi:hypothetical protein